VSLGSRLGNVADASPGLAVSECFVGVSDVDVAGVGGVVEDPADGHAGPFLAHAVTDTAPIEFVGDGAGAEALCEIAGLGLVRHTSSVIAATSGAEAIGDLSVAAGVSSTSPVAQATSTGPTSATGSGRSPGSRRPGTSKSGGGSCANIPATRWTAGRGRPIDFLQERQLTTR
jgi:hypothetical protein